MPSLTNYYISNPGAVTSTVNTVAYNDGGNSTLNHTLGNVFSLNANGSSTTIVHSNIPGERYSFELHLQWIAGTITWPSSWTKGDAAPTATGGYVITGITVDGGISWKISVLTAPVGIVQDGLVLHLDAGNYDSYPGSGTTWTDLAGSNDGTLINGPTYSSANGGCIVFDGSNDRLSSVSIPNPNGELTCEVAMNYDSKGAYHNVFDRVDRPMLWIDPNNKLEVSLSTGSGGITSSNAYNGQNIVVTAVFNSNSSPGILLYVNGNLVGTKNTTHVTWSNPSTFTLLNRDNSETFDGKLFYLRFYTKALTAAEITQNFEATRGRFGI